ncbi:MAG: GHMP kinase [bacterium]
MLIGRAPLRISFAGGGTDLPSFYAKFGGGVLSAAINVYNYCIFEKRKDKKIRIISSDYKRNEIFSNAGSIDGKRPLNLVKETIRYFSPDSGFNVFIASEIPTGSGLGLSSSVVVNLVRVLSSLKNEKISKAKIAEIAAHIEIDVCRRPIGKQDQYAASFGGLNFITFGAKASVKPVKASGKTLKLLEENLMLFFTERTLNSARVLSRQKRLIKENEGNAVSSLLALKKLAGRMKESVEKGNLNAFGELLHLSWEMKKKITSGISSRRIDYFYKLARRNGAAGGKICGAGGRGFLLFYCPRGKQEKVRHALTAGGLEELDFRFDFNGAQVTREK